MLFFRAVWWRGRYIWSWWDYKLYFPRFFICERTQKQLDFAWEVISLSFSLGNTSKELDFVVVYENTNDKTFSLVTNFSCLFSTSNLLNKINLTGKLTIVFTTQTKKGNGWSASFHISSPAKLYRSPHLIASTAVHISLSLFFHRFSFTHAWKKDYKQKCKW